MIIVFKHVLTFLDDGIKDGGVLGATAFFAFFACGVYGVDVFFRFRDWNSSKGNADTSKAASNSQHQAEVGLED